MVRRPTTLHRALLAAVTALGFAAPTALVLAAGPATAATPTPTTPTGGGGLAPTSSPTPTTTTPTPTTTTPTPPGTTPTGPPTRSSHGTWLPGTLVTQYWPAPEKWFDGAMVTPPGLTTAHRIDWLYSATGVSMQGEGLGLDGQLYHIDEIGTEGWVTKQGRPTLASDGFRAGAPFWRAGEYWRTKTGAVTYRLDTGAWAFGPGKTFVPLTDVTFALGPSKPLTYAQSIAVDPSVIPLGSRVYIPAYRHDVYHGWFIAQDTGGAINGRHVDIFRRPPANPDTGGQTLTNQRIYVIKPGSS